MKGFAMKSRQWLICAVLLAGLLCGCESSNAQPEQTQPPQTTAETETAETVQTTTQPVQEEPEQTRQTVPETTEAIREEDPIPPAYQEQLELYAKAIAEQWTPEQCQQAQLSLLVSFLPDQQSIGYCFLDLDGDGVQELIVTDGNVIYDLYALNGEELQWVLSGFERISYQLTEDNGIINRGSGSASYSYITFYRWNGGELEWVDGLELDYEANYDSPWFRRQGEQSEPEAITEEEFNQIESAYASVQIPFVPLTE